MYVDSYLELFTTLLGWTVNNIIYNVLIHTGLFMIPVGVLIYQHWKSVSTQSRDIPLAETSVKNILWDLAGLIIILVLAFVPLYTVSPTQVKFSPVSPADGRFGATVTAQNSGTTYDDTFKTVATTSPKIPMWWLLIHKISAGINYSIIDSLPNRVDLDVAKQQLAAANISDPVLAYQTNAFVSSCFVPAQGKLQQMLRSGDAPASVTRQINAPDFDPASINWIGSPILVNTPGLYSPCEGKGGCGEDLEANYNIPGLPNGSETSCAVWWQSLRQDLLAQSNPTVWQNLRANFSSLTGVTDQALEDLRIKSVLNGYTKSSGQLGDSAIKYHGEYRHGIKGELDRSKDQIGWVLKSAVGILGTSFESAKAASKMHVIKMALPMIQSIVLMTILMFLPFFLLTAGYRTGALFTFTVVFFAIKFLTPIWGIAAWAEQSLYEALYPNIDILGSLSNFAQADSFIKARLLGITTVSLWLIMPAIFLYGLVWAGVQGGQVINSAVSESNAPAKDAGGGAKQVTGSAITAGTKIKK